ncbi:ferredoxin [Candidatus Gottesmanbacteria bacterium]|nr:ferredoxin [Candidatus Gottesmanbacteria bacterium]
MGQYKVQVIRDLCIGAASCVAIAPKAFQLDNEAKAITLPTIGEESDQVLLDAAKSCPVAAIIITDQSGNQVYPA